jgi:hypothetical protein
MIVAPAPAGPDPVITRRWCVLVMSRSPVAAAFSWPVASFSIVNWYVPLPREMTSIAALVSALVAMIAARRLPLPAPPSANVVGTKIEGMQRFSRISIRTWIRADGRTRCRVPVVSDLREQYARLDMGATP